MPPGIEQATRVKPDSPGSPMRVAPWNAVVVTAIDPPISLSSPHGSVVAYAHGAQVVQWTPAGAAESALWLSPRAALDSASAIRGGIPVCFPWFGPGRDGNMTPAHGFARTATWELVEAAADDAGARMRWLLDASMAADPKFPFAYAAELEVQAAAELTVALRVRNEGQEALSYEDALHAYLAVSDVEGIRIVGLDGAEYADKARGGITAIQRGDLTVRGETDRAYRSTSRIEVHDAQRTLVIEKSGSASTVVWNPGAALASRMADIGSGLWRGFVCVEAGNVLGDAVRLAPGADHVTAYRLAVR